MGLAVLPVELKVYLADLFDKRDFCKLARTCRSWHDVAVRGLYQLDAKYGNSSAIRWAVQIHPKNPGFATGLKTIDLAVHYGGNVNAVLHGEGGYEITAIHIAAGLDRPIFVKKLLDNNADASSMCKAACLMKPLRLYLQPKLNALSRELWIPKLRQMGLVPMFYAVLHQNEQTIQLLKRHGATDTIGATTPMSVSPRYVYGSHIMAALGRTPARGTELDCVFMDGINQTTPPYGHSPMHLAVANMHKNTLEYLLENGADLEVTTDVASTPLMQAIMNFGFKRNHDVVKEQLKFIDRLLKAGADPNTQPHRSMAVTPLIAVFRNLPLHVHLVRQEIMDLLNNLLDHGADIHGRSVTGHTVIHEMCFVLYHRADTVPFVMAALKHIVKRGGDINMLLPSGFSIFKQVVVDQNRQPTQLMTYLFECHAKFEAHEAEELFSVWVFQPKFRDAVESHGYNIWQHRQSISQGAVDAAYLQAFRDKNKRALNILVKNFSQTNSLEEMVALMVGNYHFRKTGNDFKLLERSFDPNWKNKNGRGYFHIIVLNLSSESNYQEKHAVEDARKLIDKGGSVLIRDGGGKTPLQVIREREQNRRWRLLKLVLHEAKDKELGEL